MGQIIITTKNRYTYAIPATTGKKTGSDLYAAHTAYRQESICKPVRCNRKSTVGQARDGARLHKLINFTFDEAT